MCSPSERRGHALPTIRWRSAGTALYRPEALATLRGQPRDGRHLGYERIGVGMQDTGAFTGRDPLGETAAPLRHVPPDALPMSALSAHEPDGAHAIGQPTEQAWSSPFPPFLAFMDEPWRAKLARPLLHLLIPRLRCCRRQWPGTVQVSSVRPQNDADSIANAAKHIPCAASRPHYGRSRAFKAPNAPGAINRRGSPLRRAS